MKPNGPYDNMDWTPGQALREAADLADKIDADAAVVILHVNRDGAYATEMRVAGLSISAAIALLEIQKAKLVSLMHQPRKPSEDEV